MKSPSYLQYPSYLHTISVQSTSNIYSNSVSSISVQSPFNLRLVSVLSPSYLQSPSYLHAISVRSPSNICPNPVSSISVQSPSDLRLVSVLSPSYLQSPSYLRPISVQSPSIEILASLGYTSSSARYTAQYNIKMQYKTYYILYIAIKCKNVLCTI
jgi:hypothetical protein